MDHRFDDGDGGRRPDVEVPLWPSGDAAADHTGGSELVVVRRGNGFVGGGVVVPDRTHLDVTDHMLAQGVQGAHGGRRVDDLSLIHISEPTRQAEISYAV